MSSLLLNIVIGLGFVLEGVRKIADAHQKKSWKQTTGTITRATMQYGAGKYGSFGMPRVTYNYTVDGKSYEMKQRLSTMHKISSLARTLTNTKNTPLKNPYAVGESVTVFYHPKHPSSSLVQQPDVSIAILFLVLGFVFLGISLL